MSDVYVRLGYEFNLACRAFSAIGVDTADLGPVPDLLRTILEDTLSQDASPQSLDRYLPRIRDIIINLLHGLKKKQARLRSRQQREDGKSLPTRQASGGSLSTTSEQSISVNQDENASVQSPQKRPGSRRYGSSSSLEDPPLPRDRAVGSFSEREALRRETSRPANSPIHSLSSTPADTSQSPPVQYPYTEPQLSTSSKPPPANDFLSAYPAPPPPPKQDDALGALQRSGELERRASRRFSAYQIQKHLGAPSNGVPVLPSQNTPLPNRGRDVRESLNAVRLRGSYVNGKVRPSGRQESSPSRSQQAPANATISETTDRRAKPRADPPLEPTSGDGPTTKGREDKAQVVVEPDGQLIPTSAPDLPRPTEAALGEPFEPSKRVVPDGSATVSTTVKRDVSNTGVSTPTHTQFIPEVSPSPDKELTLFLQYKSKIKKFVLPEGSIGLTIGRLQLAFIEKFAWNTQQNGADLPEIYVQDPISGVRHELEDLADVKDRSVLVLNVEALDEVKRHFDDSVSTLRDLIEGVKGSIDGQEVVMQRVSERQIEAAKEIARLAASPPVRTAATTSSRPKLVRQGSGFSTSSSNQLTEVQSLRRDLAVLRQTYFNFTSDIAASMTKIRTKAGTVKTTADNLAIPSYEGDAGRARINAGKKQLADESERLVGRVDDIQDLVEDLRKDVVSRGVRPLPRQLDGVSKDLIAVIKEVRKMRQYLKTEKPIWTKIWEKELQLVCEERDQLTMQEDLAADLEDDLEKAAQTFALVEQATKEQHTQNPNANPVLRSISRTLAIDQNVDPVKARDDMLGEVRALQPNHESRLEAIERAEKARQKELESRRVDVFQKELGQFVQEGKLKKSGGHEEADRVRRGKDERIRREVWERQQIRAADLEREVVEGENKDAYYNSAVGEKDSQFGEAAFSPPSDVENLESEGSTDHGTTTRTTSPETNGRDDSDKTDDSSPGKYLSK